MPQTLLATKKRIHSIESTQKITKAMNLVSTVKLKSHMKRLSDSVVFAEQIEKVTGRLFNSLEDFESPYIKKYETNKKLYIVITSSLGLCGSYNFNLFKLIDKTITENDEVIIFGNKGLSHYANSKLKLNKEFSGFDPSDVNNLAHFLQRYILEIYPKEEYEEVNLIYTHYKNSISFIPTIKHLLPIDIKAQDEENNAIEPLIEPNKKEVINALIPFYLESTILSLLIESNVSEQASRRNAMDNATNNAQELVDELKLEYNKARQNSITSQIIEVVSASNNLQGGNWYD